MKRGGQLARRTPLQRSNLRRRPRRKRPDKDSSPYRAFIRRQPCCACGRRPPSDPHHLTGAGMGLRAADKDAMPLCRSCHDALHTFTGKFLGWGRGSRERWQLEQIATMQARYARVEG